MGSPTPTTVGTRAPMEKSAIVSRSPMIYDLLLR